MPRLDVRMTLATRVSVTERALALMVVAWLNELRVPAGLPALTETDVHRHLRHWLRVSQTSGEPEESS